MSSSPAQMARQMEESLRALEWALSVLPPALLKPEPRRLDVRRGEWSPAMQVAHLAAYEQRLAAPVLEALANGGDGSEVLESLRVGYDADQSQMASEPLGYTLDALWSARRRQIRAVESFSRDEFNRPLTQVWGLPLRPPAWVALKTLQHTWEHGNSILQAALQAE